MISHPAPRCLSQHPASKLCAEQKCSHHAIICQNHQCSCFFKHQDCMMKLEFKTLISKLMKKGESASKISDPIVQFYNETIKSLIRDKDEYLKIKEDTGFQLGDQEEELYKVLKDAGDSEVSSKSVLDVYNSLKVDPNARENEETRKEVEKESVKIQRVLTQMKELWKAKKVWVKTSILPPQNPDPSKQQMMSFYNRLLANSKLKDKDNDKDKDKEISSEQKKENQIQKIDHQFAKRLTSPLQFSFIANPKIIQRKKAYDGFLCCGLIEPALTANQLDQKLVLKINSKISNPGIFFGACYQNDKTQKSNYLTGLGGNAYLISYDGNTISHHNQEQNFKKSQFSCNIGDIVVLEYYQKSSQIVIYNRFKPNDKVSLDISNTSTEVPLYACVVMYNMNDIVQILSE